MKYRKRIAVTDKERQQIVADYLSGLSTPQIAKRLDRSDSVIVRTLKKEGVILRAPLSQQETLTRVIAADYQTGLDRETIAAKHRINKQIVSRILRKSGFQQPVRHVTDADQAVILAQYKKGKDTRQIASTTGFSSVTVAKVVKEAGISRGVYRFSAKRQLQIVDKYLAGESSEAIAKEFKVSATCITGTLKRHDVRLRSMVVSDIAYSHKHQSRAKLIDAIRNTSLYANWRKAVLERDQQT